MRLIHVCIQPLINPKLYFVWLESRFWTSNLWLLQDFGILGYTAWPTSRLPVSTSLDYTQNPLFVCCHHSSTIYSIFLIIQSPTAVIDIYMYLWKLFLYSFCQAHAVHSPPGSPHLARITSSQSPPSLSPSITASCNNISRSCIRHLLPPHATLLFYPSSEQSRVFHAKPPVQIKHCSFIIYALNH